MLHSMAEESVEEIVDLFLTVAEQRKHFADQSRISFLVLAGAAVVGLLSCEYCQYCLYRCEWQGRERGLLRIAAGHTFA